MNRDFAGGLLMGAILTALLIVLCVMLSHGEQSTKVYDLTALIYPRKIARLADLNPYIREADTYHDVRLVELVSSLKGIKIHLNPELYNTLQWHQDEHLFILAARPQKKMENRNLLPRELDVMVHLINPRKPVSDLNGIYALAETMKKYTVGSILQAMDGGK